MQSIRIGHIPNGDRFILRAGHVPTACGLMMALRIVGRYGFWFAFGPGYVNRAGLRP